MIRRPADKRGDLAEAMLEGLKTLYPTASCELNSSNPVELLVATILSAQCTDKRVNLVTPKLFDRYRSARDFAEADPGELENLIHSTGFFRAKARSIREACRALVEKFGGKVPATMAELLTLRGVARKTANVILGTAYQKTEGIVVDTHVLRLAFRMGLSSKKNPVQVERDLMEIIPEKDWIFFSHAMTWHGRRLCFARGPRCPSCLLRERCPRKGVR